jgi:hypothetical protein
MTDKELIQRRCNAVAKRYIEGEPTPGWRIETIPLPDGTVGVYGKETASPPPYHGRLQFFWKG